MASLVELGLKGVIDCHTHTGYDGYNFVQGRFPNQQSVADLVHKIDYTGVSQVVTFPFPSTEYWNTDILVRENRLVPSGKQQFPYQEENQILFEESNRFGKKVVPFVCINPLHEVRKQVDFLEKSIQNKKFLGIKLHTLATQSSAFDLISNPISEFALRHDLPILFHSGLDKVSHPDNVIKFSRHYGGKLRVCIAHVACFDQESLDNIARCDNVFVDTSPFLHLIEKYKRGTKYLARNEIINPDSPIDTIVRLYQKFKKKLIWGTDEPYTSVVKPDKGTVVEGSYAGEVGMLVDLARRDIKAFENITNRNTKVFLFG